MGENMGEIWVKYGCKLNFFPGSVDFFQGGRILFLFQENVEYGKFTPC